MGDGCAGTVATDEPNEQTDGFVFPSDPYDATRERES